MRTSVIATFLFVAALVFLCACGPKVELSRTAEEANFLDCKARAKRGDAEAQFNLGLCYRKGQGVAKNDREAVKWFRNAADQNSAEAQVYLGFCYATGQGVKTNSAEVVKWWRKAAEQNHAEAQYNLGVCFANGEGVAKDFGEAVKWWRKASEQNDANAQYSLGVCYYSGEGVEKNYVESYAWISLAAQKDEIAGKNRADVARKLSPLQIADAEMRTKELRAQIDAKLKSAGK